MKKIVLPALLALALASSPLVSQAQTCPSTASNVISVGLGRPDKSGFEITQNTTWTRNNIYLLNGAVYVNDGVTLTIESGTIIKGDLTNQGALIIRQGGKINAAGTASQPIVFTSNQPAGSRGPGDWGGLIICGRAPVNLPGNPTIEGGVVATFGGTNAADNSGVLQYVRIEYAGIAFLPNNEINGLTLGGVGSGTTIDHIQVTASGDDSFEWFGGTVNAKYLIALGSTDDDFDTDNGFSGRVQYGLAIRDPRRGDFASGGVSNGFESDNDATGTANAPQTSAVFSNMTILLPTTPTPASPFNNAAGALIRRNSAQSIFNTVITGRPYGLELNSNSTNLTTNSAQGGSLVFANNVLAGSGTRAARVTSNSGSTAGFSVNTFVGGSNDTTRTVAALGLNADNFFFEGNCSNKPCVPTLQLPTASLLNTGAAFTNAKLTGAGNGGPNSTFDVVTYRGAFGSTNWATGWTNFNPQNTCYNLPGQTLATKSASDQVQSLSVAPNPSAGAALLSFELKRADVATIRVTDALGRNVALIEAGRLAAGPQQVALPASLRNGVYVATVSTSETSQTTRFVVAK
ncbi:T9SS type A sorting domain-containing protein [Hymenobacter chitinivorans]|uniref:Putative secreted protein (Por secretion system target) n=1 Tax=Hymenobacter chitinivorans DSM 11115 TaxID=1121954 RepID=A0A2M9B999_9BACT|nr:T9SS type A sorting domain-containing protein [Hymenobacter chitinivorans]PJJ54497.1 putative secreted protein (Por secretion system target) [Hymenobacter chitinivorans DSM 11115]